MGNSPDWRRNILNKTIEYYNENADLFIKGTVNAKMTDIQEKFLKHIPQGGRILDLGCGSGRDSKAFIDASYEVILVDGSKEMCRAAHELTGREVIHSTFQEYEPNVMFDGIWASASLLHLEEKEICGVIKKFTNFLKKDGCFYMSFKYGDFAGERNGRFFTNLTEESFQNIIINIKELKKVDEIITFDVRPGREEEKWLNEYFVKR